MAGSCSSCVKDSAPKAVHRTSLISTLLVIIIPKCPLCIMAYTSAVTMCGGPDMYFAENNWVSYIPILLSFLVSAMILFNRKGLITLAALSVALAGTALVILTHQLVLAPGWYHAGTVLLILAIWMNGSFRSFTNAIWKLIKRLEVSWSK